MSSSDDDSFDCAGKATDGKRYDSIASMWAHELRGGKEPLSEQPEHQANQQSSTANPNNHRTVDTTGDDDVDDDDVDEVWYNKSEAYWAEQKASVAGMLGGLDKLHARDVNASRRFLNSLSELQVFKRHKALDVGAGIGRVTRYLLSDEFDVVDMLEQSVSYLQESHTYLESVKHKVGRRIACGMQEFRADGLTARDGVESGELRQTYNVVWIQWTVIYLLDDDFVDFIKECVKSLTPDGIIVLKDNVARSGFLVDKDDSSIMRSNRYMMHLFKRSGVEVIKQARQLDFPKGIFPVRMYALRPRLNTPDSDAAPCAGPSHDATQSS